MDTLSNKYARSGARFGGIRFADLSDFYPKTQNPSPNGSGAPSNPGTPSPATDKKSSPALFVLLFVAAGFLLLHQPGT